MWKKKKLGWELFDCGLNSQFSSPPLAAERPVKSKKRLIIIKKCFLSILIKCRASGYQPSKFE